MDKTKHTNELITDLRINVFFGNLYFFMRISYKNIPGHE